MMGFQALGRLALGQIPSPPGIAAETGSLVVALEEFVVGKGAVFETATFTLTGVDASLVEGVIYTLTADVAGIALAGVDAGLSLRMGASPASYALAGAAAGLGVMMTAEAGSFALSGSAVLRRGLLMHALPSIATGQAVQFGFAALGEVALGQGLSELTYETLFVLRPEDVMLRHGLNVSAGTGDYILTGVDVELTALLSYPTRVRVFPSTGRGVIASHRGGQAIRAFPATGRGTRARAFGG